MTQTLFNLPMTVRDYECDMQGIVNNAVYQNYLEHARHEFLLSKGLDFSELTSRGVIVVVIRAELDYKQPLRSGDSFLVSVATRQVSRLKLTFDQQIRKQPDGELMLEAQITATSLNARNRPYFPEELKVLL
ncbi:MAG: acyl-CoA thioesterase [Pseudohongiella sp.]|jgi:acyl-CoA thioester hydrolase|nr:acyl-CoA thioesterase [Pseudohongiella sp.]